MDKKKIFTIAILTIIPLALLVYYFGGQIIVNPPTQTASISSSDQTNNIREYSVIRVIDGDTIVVDMNGHDETVRLIGVNTPETVDPRKPVQCFGREASDFLKTMLPAGTKVGLVSDPTQSNRDKYGRLLRYAYLGDVLVDEEIISAGYGFEYTYDIPYKFQKKFKASENYAREGSLGLWATATCNGKLIPVK